MVCAKRVFCTKQYRIWGGGEEDAQLRIKVSTVSRESLFRRSRWDENKKISKPKKSMQEGGQGKVPRLRGS